MKTLLFTTLLCLFLLSSASAQKGTITVGLEGGLCASNIWGMPGFKATDTRYLKYSPAGGVSLGYGLGRKLMLRTGLYYENKGAGLSLIRNTSDYDPDRKETSDFEYLVVPLLLRFMPCPNGKFFLNAGPYIGFLQQQTERTTHPGHPTREIDRTDSYRKVDFGLSFGVGYTQPIKPRLAISIEMRGNLGLTNTRVDREYKDYAIKMNSINVLLGVAYMLGKEQKR